MTPFMISTAILLSLFLIVALFIAWVDFTLNYIRNEYLSLFVGMLPISVSLWLIIHLTVTGVLQ